MRAYRSTRSRIARRGQRASSCWRAPRAGRCSPSPAPGRPCSSASSRSSPATTCSASKAVSVGYIITDHNGRMVDSKSADMRLLPTMTGVPSALQYTSGASLAPGEYTLKLAAVEGERVGTVEHTMHATLPESGGITLSELMVGGPLEVGQLLTPTIGYQITFGSVHGYVEAYGAKTDGVTMEYEIATGPDAPALFNADVPPHAVGDARVIFTRVMPTHALPPGKYILRAILSAGGKSIKTL